MQSSRAALSFNVHNASLGVYKCALRNIETQTMEGEACTNSRSYGTNFVCKCPFSILTFNVYPGPPLVFHPRSDLYPTRIAAQIKALREVDADIVCLQELYCHKSFLELCQAFPDYNVMRDPGMEETDCRGHPRRRQVNASILGLVATLLYIGSIWCFSWRPALLPFAAAVALWAGAYLVLPRNSGVMAWLRNRGTGLAIMVRRSKAIVIDHSVVRFHSQVGDLLNLVAPRGYSRTILALETACDCGPCGAVVFNTHLNALGSSKNRVLQAKQLAKEIRRMAPTRTVLCGDFNEEPVWKSGVRECFEGDGPQDANLMIADPAHQITFCPELNALARNGCFKKSECIDHIYFKPGLEGGLVPTDQARVVFTDAPPLSDHYGLLAKFQ